jgi:cytochrome c biogenesis protein CcmG, thiol:disulfide interchange protein DsbE
MLQYVKRHWNLFALIILALGAFWIWFSRTAPGSTTNGDIPSPHPGFQAPDFVARTLTGESVRLSDLRGSPLIINLWASWCLPCQKEMPAMQRVFAEYADQGLYILAVNATSQDQKEKVIDFAQDLGLTFPILFDETGEISNAYLLTALPTTFFVSADGIIQDVVVGGPISEALLRSHVEQLIKDSP